MDNKINSEDIIKLIRLGRVERIDARRIIINEDLKDRLKIVGICSPELLDVAKKLSDGDLRLLYKGLVHIEGQLRCGGSGASAGFIYSIIIERGIDWNNSLAEFGLRNCDNGSVPFGSSYGIYSGERTYEAYVKNMELDNKRRLESWEKHQKIQNRVKDRKDRRKKALAELRKMDRDTQNEIRAKFKEQYANASIEEKFTLMVNDEKYPPEYYPIEWAIVSKEDISDLTSNLKRQLYDKLSTNVIRKHWKRLSKLLSKYDDA